MSHPLPLTGERTLPGVRGEEYWFARHEAAYAWLVSELAHKVRGAAVVEAGSGEGYGAAMLRAAGARSVLALEYDDPSARHAHAAYTEVRTVRANLAMLPVATASADLLVTLQVVEHLWDLRGFLRDCARVLRPGGAIVVTTPNRPVFSPGLGRGEKPTNPFHVEELDAEQLHDLLVDAGFVDVVVHGLHHGQRIEAWESEHGSGIVAAQVAAVLGEAGVPDGLDAFVASVTAADFVVAGHDGAQDLIAVAVRP
ncbi:MAG: class I SAM-dependent methyltransferase [Candidatus Nanopelagicales bacterium]